MKYPYTHLMQSKHLGGDPHSLPQERHSYGEAVDFHCCSTLESRIMFRPRVPEFQQCLVDIKIGKQAV
jgi:hypothetical protein